MDNIWNIWNGQSLDRWSKVIKTDLLENKLYLVKVSPDRCHLNDLSIRTLILDRKLATNEWKSGLWKLRMVDRVKEKTNLKTIYYLYRYCLLNKSWIPFSLLYVYWKLVPVFVYELGRRVPNLTDLNITNPGIINIFLTLRDVSIVLHHYKMHIMIINV